MKHIYVASHGHFARGLVNSLSLLIGDEHGVIPVCAYDEDIVTTEQLEQTLEHLIVQANGDEVVIFTDLLGGSINNSAVSVLMRHRNVFRGRRHQSDSAAGVSAVRRSHYRGRDYLRHQRGA